MLLFHFTSLIFLLEASAARYNVVPKFGTIAQDSAIIIDTDIEPPPTALQTFPNTKSSMLSYYQPIQSIPSYKIISKIIAQNKGRPTSTTPKAAIFTQEEFPRDLLEIAQKKLGLKTLDEVPSVTELAELLGTNSAAETISYIRQLTSTDQGIALMKAYIESSDYTDNVSNKNNEVIESEMEANVVDYSTTLTPQLIESMPTTTENTTKPGFLQRIASYLNIYDMLPQQTQILKQKLSHTNAESTPTTLRRPLYVRNPLPYHYPIPLRPVLIFNRTNFNDMRIYSRPVATAPSSTKLPKLSIPPHMNTLKALTPAHIQQLARMANLSPRTLESFLQRKPKLAELAAKVASFPMTQESGTDVHLLAAVHKAIENDEDLRKLLNSTETLK